VQRAAGGDFELSASGRRLVAGAQVFAAEGQSKVTHNPSGQAFWEFSLRVYAQPGVQEECLVLQERLRLDVNLLLFCAYAGAKLGIELSPQDIADTIALTEAWQDSVVRSLREVRTTMKRWSEDKTLAIREPTATLRLAVKKAELDSERIEHEMLADWATNRNAPPERAPPAVVTANISLLIDHYARVSGETATLPRQLTAAALSDR
jgi:uncharacterized protein (TIGR02444 family)